jgi:hypothetical protein
VLQPAGAAQPAGRGGAFRWVALVGGTALLLGALALVGLRVRSELQARELAAQLAQLNVEADRALKAREWDEAIARADDGLKLSFSDETLRDKRARAVVERAARDVYDRFVAAARGRDYDRALEEWKALPAASVYRGIAESMRSEVLDGYVEAHVQKARALQQEGKCPEALREVAVVLAADDGNEAARQLVNACQPQPPPAPVALPPAATAKKGRAKGPVKSLGTELLTPH